MLGSRFDKRQAETAQKSAESRAQQLTSELENTTSKHRCARFACVWCGVLMDVEYFGTWLCLLVDLMDLKFPPLLSNF